MKERIIRFSNKGIMLEGVIRYPDDISAPVPCLVLMHGSMDHDRDGNLLETADGRPLFKNNFFLNISKRLCSEGYATLSWDKRGYGESSGIKGGYFSQASDAKAAIDKLINENSDLVDTKRIVGFGQSAGAYVQCLVAKDDSSLCAHILSGCLYRDYYDMMSFNYHRVRDYAQKSPENLEWAEKNDLWGLKLGLNLDRMFEAINSGKSEWIMEYKGVEEPMHVDLKEYSEEAAPKRQFRYIKKPTLVIHGREDLNVPVQDAYDIDSELRACGNRDVELVIIPGVDHSFQHVAEDEETRLRERMSLDSRKRTMSEEYLGHLCVFMKRVCSI